MTESYLTTKVQKDGKVTIDVDMDGFHKASRQLTTEYRNKRALNEVEVVFHNMAQQIYETYNRKWGV